MGEPLRAVPSVERLLAILRERFPATPHAALLDAARLTLAAERDRLRAGAEPRSATALADEAASAVRHAARPSLRRVINASGVVLQTNLGRAPLSERAIAAMVDAARGYTNLEYDLAAGARGSRHEHVRTLLRRVTGAEDALAVNNNAAALFMVLQVFAGGREVVVSRAHAVEIGGGFRIPDVCRQSGATLVEVGTTNRTYAHDYAAATGPATAAYLRVHASNFRVVGFTAEAPLAALVTTARERGVLVFDDLGSGCLVDTRALGMAPEPRVQESLAAGADLVLFSGDKLLGGPQCGIIVGRSELIARLRAHPLARALRVDKLTIAALNATLQAYADGRAFEEIPVWRMLAAPAAAVRRRAARWASVAGPDGSVVAARTMAGGGSLPGEGVPTWCARVAVAQPDALAARLRGADPPVIARVEGGTLLLDPRTVDPRDDPTVRRLLAEALRADTQSP